MHESSFKGAIWNILEPGDSRIVKTSLLVIIILPLQCIFLRSSLGASPLSVPSISPAWSSPLGCPFSVRHPPVYGHHTIPDLAILGPFLLPLSRDILPIKTGHRVSCLGHKCTLILQNSDDARNDYFQLSIVTVGEGKRVSTTSNIFICRIQRGPSLGCGSLIFDDIPCIFQEFTNRIYCQ